MLPCSTLEKMLSKLLISSLLYPIALILFYSLLAGLSEIFNWVIFGSRYDFFNPFLGGRMSAIPYYLVGQSIFFAGATYFRKHPFAKTLLFLALMVIVLSLISASLLRIFYGGSFMNQYSIDSSQYFASVGRQFKSFSHFIISLAKIVFWGLIPPFCYVLSYFKLSEKEIRDGF